MASGDINALQFADRNLEPEAQAHAAKHLIVPRIGHASTSDATLTLCFMKMKKASVQLRQETRQLHQKTEVSSYCKGKMRWMIPGTSNPHAPRPSGVEGFPLQINTMLLRRELRITLQNTTDLELQSLNPAGAYNDSAGAF